MESPKLCGINGLVFELRLPRDWLLAEARAGRIPCLKIGSKLFFNIDAVRLALAERAAQEYWRGAKTSKE